MTPPPPTLVFGSGDLLSFLYLYVTASLTLKTPVTVIDALHLLDISYIVINDIYSVPGKTTLSILMSVIVLM